MTKAEQLAVEAYNDMFHNPEKMSVRSTISPEEVAESNFDYKEPFKAFFLDVYQQGYEQAKKDLALTPDDIKLITKIHYEIVFKDTTGIKVGDIASEVLKRFKEAKP